MKLIHKIMTHRSILPTALIAFFLAISTFPVFADTLRDIQLLKRASKARAAIVKKVSPTVVHISVEKTVSTSQSPVPRSPRKSPQDPNSPDYFQDDFFRKFFKNRMPKEHKQRGLGSGAIVDSRGYIITNNHVVGGADKIIVKLVDGREFTAVMVGADPASDIAVVKIKAKNLPVARLGNSDKLDVGESVIAIGNPFGLEQTITAGIVSAKGRSALGVTDYEDFIQTDASINPGNSGGPLINLDGEVVGINTAIYSRSGGNQGIGFAIPVNMARSIMDSLISSGKVVRGYLGVWIQDVDKAMAEAMGVKVKGGVAITNVGPGSPAEKAGIRSGDIIISFGGKKTKTANILRNTVAAIKPGSKVPALIIRGGKKIKLQVVVVEQPSNMRAAILGKKNKPAPSRKSAETVLGFAGATLTPEQAERFGYEGVKGVLVTRVVPGSQADEAGLTRGSLIIKVKGKSVRSLKQFRRAFRKAPRKKPVLVLVRNGAATRFLTFRKP